MTRLRCEATFVETSSRPRHIPGHRGRLRRDGTWRELIVHEIVPFPKAAGTSQRLVSGGELVQALDPRGAPRGIPPVDHARAGRCRSDDG